MRRRAAKAKTLSEYSAMWLVAMFDLPVDTPEARKRYTQFRKALLTDGFLMLQFSVYARYLEGEESATAHRRYIRNNLPPSGQVRVLAVTDHQFGKMEVFAGKKRGKSEDPPGQLLLF